MNVRVLPAPRTLRLPSPWTVGAWTVLAGYVLLAALQQHHGDAWAYWSADLDDLYAGSALMQVSYVYPPPLAQAIEPLRALPFGMFLGLLTALEIGALAYLVGPRWAALLVIAGPINLADELINANINLLLGVAVVWALRRPAWWALPLVTKVTPVVALAYHVARHEYRHLLMALGVSALIALGSFALSPAAWVAWRDFVLTGSPDHLLIAPLAVRLAVAAGLAYWAGVTGRRWPLPIAVVIAMPLPGTIHWTAAIAAIPLARDDLRPE